MARWSFDSAKWVHPALSYLRAAYNSTLDPWPYWVEIHRVLLDKEGGLG